MAIIAGELFIGTEAEKPLTGAQPGDHYFASDTGIEYVWSATGAWEELGNRKLIEQMELDQLRRDHEKLFDNEQGGDRYGFEIR